MELLGPFDPLSAGSSDTKMLKLRESVLSLNDKWYYRRWEVRISK
jgi:hypothetical protein